MTTDLEDAIKNNFWGSRGEIAVYLLVEQGYLFLCLKNLLKIQGHLYDYKLTENKKKSLVAIINRLRIYGFHWVQLNID